MGSSAKYLFDNDFASAGERKSSIALAEHAAKLAEAEAVGYRNGFTAGQGRSRAARGGGVRADRRRAGRPQSRPRRRWKAGSRPRRSRSPWRSPRSSRRSWSRREPFAEISALVADCFRHLVAAPHVVVRVSDALHAGAREKLEDRWRATPRPGWWCWPSPTLRPAIAASNGRTAASSATAQRSRRRSTRPSPATSARAAASQRRAERDHS